MSDESCSKAMSGEQAWGLTLYLVIATLICGWGVYSLWSLQPKAELNAPAAPEADAPKPCSTEPKKGLSALKPLSNDVTAPVKVWIEGCGFSKSTVVNFNGSQHTVTVASPNQIRLVLAASDIASTGKYLVTVTEDATVYGTGVILVVAPIAEWDLPWMTVSVNQETILLLLVIAMGALGSSIYALKSVADYKGQGQLNQSWLIFYVVQPFEGSGIAVLMYLVVRGGFLAGTGADVKTVNQFGICAIAGLSGTFSDIAFMKLREVFQTLFKPQDNRGGKVDQFTITTSSLPNAIVNQAYSQVLQTKNGTAPLNWSVSPDLPAGLTLDPPSGTIAGVPTGTSPKTNYSFSVTDSSSPAATASCTLALQIDQLAITTASLPNAAVNKDYKQVIQSNSGSSAVTWAVNGLPNGLAIDGPTGTITGKPTAAGGPVDCTFTVTDNAHAAATATKTLPITVV